MNASGVSPEEQARAGVYSLLGALFAAAPGPDLLSLLGEVPENGAGEAPMTGAWRGLAAAARSADPGRLAQEYHDLFIGVGRGELLPYASPYLTGFLHDRPLVDLREDLARLGLARTASTREPEDHIAALCEAMAHLVSAPGGYPFEEQKAFFDRHLRPWAARFMVDLQAARAADFYRAVGRFGAGFLGLEQRYFDLQT